MMSYYLQDQFQKNLKAYSLEYSPHYEYYRALYSTHTLAQSLPPSHCYWIVAAEQLSGYGRQNRSWIHYPGDLAATAVWSPVSISTPYECSIVFAVAVHKALTFWMKPSTLRLKWPNDLYLGHQKLAGMLSEYHNHKLIFSLGLNHSPRKTEQGAHWPLPPFLTFHQWTAYLWSQLDIAWRQYQEEGIAAAIEYWRLYDEIPYHADIRIKQAGILYEGLYEGVHASGALQVRLSREKTHLFYDAYELRQILEK